jgi:hypothetical protein
MPAQELRAHVRLQTESRALMYLPDGSRVRCQVRDISMGGAYLLRTTEYGEPAAIEDGAEVRLYLFHPGSGDGFNIEATVVRAEKNGGGGVALRFSVYEDTRVPFVNHMHRQADKAGVKRSVMGVPTIRMKDGLNQDVKTILFRRGAIAAAVLFGLWGLRIARDWLAAVL